MTIIFLMRRIWAVLPLLILTNGILIGQWSRNSAVNTFVAGGRGNQAVPIVVSDGASGAIIAWQDNRDTATRGIDLYAQRLNSRGLTQWTANGITISRAAGNQIALNAVPDGRGGMIIVWQDTRIGNSDIYAQHVSSDSTKLWTVNGTPICTEGHEQTLPVIAADNLGGAFIVWQDYRNGNADLYAQHINSGGNALWTADGVPVVTASNDQVLPAVISDGNSGMIVAWQDLRNGSDFDIYAQKLQGTGLPAWTANGVVVSNAANHQRYPALVTDGALGAFVAWEDYRNDVPNVFLQRITTSGSASFTANGIAAASSAFGQTQPRMIPDGLGGAVVAWTDVRNGDADIFAQNVTSGGVLQWTSSGLAVCSAAGIQRNPALVTDAYNGAIVTWEDYRNTTPDIYAQRVLSNGSLLWTINGVGVGTQASAQVYPAIVENSSHGAIVVWQDSRNSGTQGSDLYAQLVNDIGTLGGYSIHGYFFNDLNRDGLRQAGEDFLLNWTINLSGPTTKTATTDSSGAYSFDGLATGIYTMQPQVRNGWMFTVPPDSIVNLTIGGDSIRNYPAFQLGTITVSAYRDGNHDGIFEPGEPADPGRTIRLSGASTATATTDNAGSVVFIGLPVGTFYLTEDPLAGFMATSSPAIDTVVIDTLGEDLAGAGFGSFYGGRVSGRVYNDLTGDSAVTADSTITGWEVRLYKGTTLVRDTLTNSSGVFSFTSLDTGKYVLIENVASGWFQTYPKPPGDTLFNDGTRGYKIPVDGGGLNFVNKDFGNFRSGVISGRVLEDMHADSIITGDPGLAGWCIKLYSAGVLVDRQYTDGSGNFRFSNIVGGSYTLEESLATGYRQTFPRTDTSLAPNLYGVSAGPNAYKIKIVNGKNVSVSFANYRVCMIGGVVHMDVTGDSIVLGDPVIPRWQVRLSRGGTTLTTTTDERGRYAFTNLDSGMYLVQEIEAVTAVQTYPRITMPNILHPKDSNIRIYREQLSTSGQADSDLDFGVSTGLIRGNVFSDINGDATRGDEDTPLQNVVIRLTGRKVDSTLTDVLGNFYFAGLDTGSYTVAEDLQSGWVRTYPKVPGYYLHLTPGSRYIPDIDFGNFQNGAISGTVYFDRDSNQSRETRDVGLSGWKVYLKGTRKDSIITGPDGSYRFSGLPIGIYYLMLKPQSGWTQTAPHDSLTVAIASGVNSQQADFGLTGLGRISGTLYEDLDRNGLKGPGEPGLGGFRILAQVESRIDTLLTDPNGTYSFLRLGPGVYTISRALPADWIHTSPAPAPTYTVSLAASGIASGKDFLDFNLGIIRGEVFSDDNANGLPDSLEPGIAGIMVYLTGAKTDSALTASDGSYQFAGLDTGRYVIQERNIPFVVRSVPLPPWTYTESFTSSGEIKTGRNFGHFRTTSISGLIFNDLACNGTYEVSDPPIGGWKVHLHRADGSASVDSIVTTQGDGVFQFTGVSPGKYLLVEELPPGWYQTLPAAPDTISISSPGQSVTGKSLANYFALFSGRVFDDLNGNGTCDPGEPGRSAIRMSLVRNGFLIDSTATDTLGAYVFRNHGVGTYMITQAADPAWAQTLSPLSIVLTQPSGSTFANLNFGDFRRFSITGFAFEDLNRNGAMDGGEAGLVQCIISIKKDGLPFSIDTSLADGSYGFLNLGPGTYKFAQQNRTGYLKSVPLGPDTVTVTGQSGVSVSPVNFGNYLNISRSITARVVSDLDGALATPSDRTAKPWSIALYRAGVLLKSVTGGSLDTTNLPIGTYVVQVADSSGRGWSILGERRTIHRTSLADSIIQRSAVSLMDTIVLGGSESHVADFIVTRLGAITVRSFADADANVATGGDWSGQVRTLEIYQNFVAPANLVKTLTDSVIPSWPVGAGTFVMRQVASSAWQSIASRVNGVNRSNAYDTVRVALSFGMVDTIDFVNGGLGTIVARNRIDGDGDTLTAGDQQFAPWAFSLYKNTLAPANRVDSVYAESLAVQHLAGSYIVRQTRPASWKTLRASLDTSEVEPLDTFRVVIVGGDTHGVDLINGVTGGTKFWTGQADSRWENRLNWLPAVLPIKTDSIVIQGDRSWRVPRFPGHSAFKSIVVNQNAGALLPSTDTLLVNGAILNNGLLQADPSASPAVVVNGDFNGSGTFSPGQSRVIVTSDLPRSVAGGAYASLSIGGPGASIQGTRAPSPITINRLLGSAAIATELAVLDTLDITGDTVALASDAWNGIHGAGPLLGGTIVRAIHSGENRPYRFWEDSTYIRFDSLNAMPSSITGRVLQNTSPTAYGATWDSLGGVVDSVHHTVAVSGISFFSSRLPFAFGTKVGTEWKPVLRTLYLFEAQPESGYSATISLQYLPADLPPGMAQGSLSLVRLRLVNVSVECALASGWNLVSLPVIYTDSDKRTIFPTASSEAFSYLPGGGYQVADQLSTGYGYWLKFPTGGTYCHTGIERPSDSIAVQPGWNLIGSISYPVAVGDIGTSPSGLIQTPVFGLSHGYTAADSIRPGLAYWVNCSGAGTIVLNPMAGGAKKRALQLPTSALNELVIADAAGHRQVLHFGPVSETARALFALPPTPPAEMFDARFASNSAVAGYALNDGKDADFRIDIQGAVLPLTVSWRMAAAAPFPVTIATGGSGTGRVTTLGKEGSFRIEKEEETAMVLSVHKGKHLPESYALYQNYPNPFNPTTTIRFDLPTNALVTLRIYNVLGQVVATLHDDEFMAAGTQEIRFDAGRLASGVYFYRIAARTVGEKENGGTTFQSIRKMMLVK